MKIENLIRENIKQMESYASARDEFKDFTKEMVYLDANENPFPNGINRYPDPYQLEVKNKIADVFQNNDSFEAKEWIDKLNGETYGEAFFKLIRNPFLFRFFLFTRLPAAFFAGLRLELITPARTVVKLRYQFLTKNPFRSTYFACLSMAAEMSTGALALGYVYKRTPSVSMLVIKTEGEYFKKATGITMFTCEDGALIKKTIEEAVLISRGLVEKK